MSETDPTPDYRPDQGELCAIAARCFAGIDGRRLWAHLKRLTLERTLGPDACDRTLRHLEGQRQLVQHLGHLIERGRRGPAESATMKTD